MSVQAQIEQTVKSNPVVLFMKGNKEMPMCGFSARAVNVLKACNASFITIDVLQDEAIRQGIKEYANWPTIPQLYINGEFIGGSDIIAEMFEAGELQPLLNAVK